MSGEKAAYKATSASGPLGEDTPRRAPRSPQAGSTRPGVLGTHAEKAGSGRTRLRPPDGAPCAAARPRHQQKGTSVPVPSGTTLSPPLSSFRTRSRAQLGFDVIQALPGPQQ